MSNKVLASASSNDGKRNPFKSILSGGIAGGIEICCTFPTEYVKTQLQLQDKLKPQYSGVMDCVKKTVRTNGFFGLYTGLSSLFYLSIPKTAIRFFAYETCKNFLLGDDVELTRGKTLLAGLGAGVTEAILIVTPMETIKVKFINDQTSGKPRFRNFAHGVSTIVKETGISGIYKGLFPTILKQGSNQAIRFLNYNEFKSFFTDNREDKKLKVHESMIAGAVAGAGSVFGNTPLDVVKTKMQGLEASKYRNSLHCVKEIFKNDGIRGFYKGTLPRLGRVCADVAIVMSLYEQINKVMDKIF